MQVTVDLTKLLAVVLVVVGSIFLTYTGHMESQACVAILGGAMGYVYGNGHGVGQAKQYADRAERAAARAAAQVKGEVNG